MKAGEDIIEAEFSVVDDDKIGDMRESHFWMLVGENLPGAKLVKISTMVDAGEAGRYNGISVDCYVSQIEGAEIKNSLEFKVSEKFNGIPTKEEQKEMIKRALSNHKLTGEIWQMSEQYAKGHLNSLQIQKRIKGGAKCSNF